MKTISDAEILDKLDLNDSVFSRRALGVRAWRQAESHHGIKAPILETMSFKSRPVPGFTRVELDGTCKFQNRGAPCVSHCGDPVCLPKSTTLQSP